MLICVCCLRESQRGLNERSHTSFVSFFFPSLFHLLVSGLLKQHWVWGHASLSFHLRRTTTEVKQRFVHKYNSATLPSTRRAVTVAALAGMRAMCTNLFAVIIPPAAVMLAMERLSRHDVLSRDDDFAI